MTNRFNQQQQQDSNPKKTKFPEEPYDWTEEGDNSAGEAKSLTEGVDGWPEGEEFTRLYYLRVGLEGQNETLLINIAYLMGLHRSYIESPEEPTQQRDRLLEIKRLELTRNIEGSDTLKKELLAIAQPQENEYPTIENLANTSISYIFMILNQKSCIDNLADKIENRG